ncbi:MAG: hypothetical protein HQL52_13135 [Magnetococcales bacterium]|nr:hypothetical protein [Magnetococcales bacterium]
MPAAMLLGLLSLLLPGTLRAEGSEWDHWEVSGHIAAQTQWFPKSPGDSSQRRFYPSLSFQPEFYREWDGGNQSLTFVPFVRLDAHDTERTHGDIRELTWLKAADFWEFRAGLRKVYWGVTESQHLVDVINQTDLVESPDGEEKLGQPMVNLSLSLDWGTLDLYWLPWFRERTFPGREGRLRTPLVVDTDQTRYESAAGESHQDFAIRWFQTLGDWEVGLSHFSGTSRDPSLIPGTNDQGEAVLIPYYEKIDQTGVDVQGTFEAWLWKGEIISRSGQGDRYTALTAGLEYTFVGILESDADLGVIAEYLFDDRNNQATSPFEDDIMAGFRLALNDTQSSDLLLGAIVDRESGAVASSLEANRRLWDDWKISLEGRYFGNIPSNDPLYAFKRDHYLQLELARYY